MRSSSGDRECGQVAARTTAPEFGCVTPNIRTIERTLPLLRFPDRLRILASYFPGGRSVAVAR
jgi:hypothetical protein